MFSLNSPMLVVRDTSRVEKGERGYVELGLHVELAQDKLEVRRPSHARSACWIVKSLSTSSLPDQKGAVIAAMDCVEVAKDAWTAGERDADKRSEALVQARSQSLRARSATAHRRLACT